MMHTELWLSVKYTLSGKLGAALIGSAPVLFVVELSNHIDALIAALPPTMAIIVGVIALLKGQKTMMVNIDGRMQELLEEKSKASRAEGKEEERVESRDRRDQIKIELRTQELGAGPKEVSVINPPENPVQSEVINPSNNPVHTLEQRQIKIDKAQEKLDVDKRESE